MGLRSIFNIPTSGYKPCYLLLDYRIWAVLIICVCLLIILKKPKLKKIASLTIIEDIIMTLRMIFIEMDRGWFCYIYHSSLLLEDDRLSYNLGSALFGCAVLIIGIIVLSGLYLITEKVVNYKKNEK